MKTLREIVSHSSTNLITEELNEYQKQIVDKWGQSHEARSLSNHVMGDKDRVVVPFVTHQQTNEPLAPHPDVHQHLQNHGYQVTDYRAGLANEPHGKYPSRQMRIGSILQQTNAPKNIVNAFTNDDRRKGVKQESKNLQMVISRHPHDIAGMSTDRGWTSCMRLPTDKNESGGSNHHYLERDLEHGTHVAYLTEHGDNEAKNPLARIALKPFVHEESNHTILRPEHAVYGETTGSFEKNVSDWATKHFPVLHEDAVYRKHSRLYDDSHNTVHYGPGAVNKILNGGDYSKVSSVIQHGNMTTQQIDGILNDRDGHFHNDHKIALAGRSDLTPEHQERLVQGAGLGTLEHQSILEGLSANRSLPLSTVNKVIDRSEQIVNMFPKNSNVRDMHKSMMLNLSDRSDLSKGHLDKIIDTHGGISSPTLPSYLAVSPSMKGGTLDHYLDKVSQLPVREQQNSKFVSAMFGSNKNMKPDHIKKAMSVAANVPTLLEHVARNPGTTSANLHDILDQAHRNTKIDSDTVRRNVLGNKNADESHIDRILDQKHIMPAISKSHLLTNDHLHKIADDPDMLTGYTYQKSFLNRLQPEHYSKIIDNAYSPFDEHGDINDEKSVIKYHNSIQRMLQEPHELRNIKAHHVDEIFDMDEMPPHAAQHFITNTELSPERIDKISKSHHPGDDRDTNDHWSHLNNGVNRLDVTPAHTHNQFTAVMGFLNKNNVGTNSDEGRYQLRKFLNSSNLNHLEPHHIDKLVDADMGKSSSYVPTLSSILAGKGVKLQPHHADKIVQNAINNDENLVSRLRMNINTERGKNMGLTAEHGKMLDAAINKGS
jgi:hypothetical protein